MSAVDRGAVGLQSDLIMHISHAAQALVLSMYSIYAISSYDLVYGARMLLAASFGFCCLYFGVSVVGAIVVMHGMKLERDFDKMIYEIDQKRANNKLSKQVRDN